MNRHIIRGLREGALIFFGVVALYMLASLATYQPNDPGWSMSRGDVNEVIANSGGVTGAWFSDVFLYLFGWLAYLFPVLVFVLGWLTFKARFRESLADRRHWSFRLLGFALTLVGGAGLASMHFSAILFPLPLTAGGLLGNVIAQGLVAAFSFLGATLLLLSLFLTGFSLFSGMSWLWLMDATGGVSLNIWNGLLARIEFFRETRAGRKARKARQETVKIEKKKAETRAKPRIEPVIKKVKISERVERERQVPLFDIPSDGELPALSLLDPAEESVVGLSEAALEALSRQVELKLKEFNVDAVVESVHPGPVVTRFELMLSAGTKVSQISNLAKDLARALSIISIRVVEVIPGKSTIGLEIPNEQREMVRLSEILGSSVSADASSVLTLGLGKDISGLPVVADLAKMPHLLVAGTTGSGKSVAVNAMILSLLYNATPREVRLIMIDPKMLELSVYEGIPHLLAPVVTDMKEAANAFRWCVAEMERRYKLMSALGVRNIGGYNRKVTDAEEAGSPLKDPLYQSTGPDDEVPNLEELPFIVIVVDELADMMMVVGKKVETLIARLAQKARAAGVHLILATQRPSVDVLTGLIKANIPTRIAFQVSSRIDSRTILDQMGAEQLLGHGDMLYLPAGTSVPTRVHGAFVDDHEVHNVVKALKKKGPPNYIEAILQGVSEESGFPGAEGDDAEADELYDQAVQIVTETRRASVSGIQRRLKVGYNRAARMVEEMERAGVVSELQSNGMREVLAPPPPKG